MLCLAAMHTVHTLLMSANAMLLDIVTGDSSVLHGHSVFFWLCRLRPGGLITEGTAGSTGVSLAMVSGTGSARHATV